MIKPLVDRAGVDANRGRRTADGIRAIGPAVGIARWIDGRDAPALAEDPDDLSREGVAVWDPSRLSTSAMSSSSFCSAFSMRTRS